MIVRPAFTLGGTGGGIADNEEMLRDIAKNGLRLSPITQVLIEKCISGWKEIEFEVIRDRKGNVITVCSMENFDPVGVHTGDSIVVAPAVTLTDREYQMLRTACYQHHLRIEGRGRLQLPVCSAPRTSMEYAVIEVNPRVSRSSALASKATGYPIAKVATRIAIGYTLDEIVNQVTGKTYACFEPALDYVVVKFPKWAFDKFVYAKRTLGTQMKATGEVMAIGTSFEQAIMKAVRSIELGVDSMNMKKYAKMSLDEIMEHLKVVDDERAFQVFEALKRGVTVEELHEKTMIDCWFLNKLLNLVRPRTEMAGRRNADRTEVPAGKAIRLSGQHHRTDVRSEVPDASAMLFIRWLIPVPANSRQKPRTSIPPMMKKTKPTSSWNGRLQRQEESHRIRFWPDSNRSGDRIRLLLRTLCMDTERNGL